jgi:hypothetical protein
MSARKLKEECDRLNAINAELVAALRACRPFIAYTQAYDQRRMTAGEATACDQDISLTNDVLRKAGGIYG